MADSTTRRGAQRSSEGAVANASDASEPSGPRAANGDLAGALHEVSNALTVVMGWIGRARDGGHTPREVERALDVAAARASQARAIVRRAIGAEVDADPPRAVADVLRDTLIGLEPEAKNAGVRVKAVLADDASAVAVADGSLVVQILTNLLLNAFAVSRSGQRVLVEASVEADGESVTFAVHDEGPGIPEHRRASLFASGISTRRGGAGIGLRYAASLARAAGGDLSLAKADAGARFELRWPALDESTRPSQIIGVPSAVARLPLEGTRILILEDDVAVVDLLDTALTARGADVVSIHHERDLATALGTGRFDVALFDISPIQKDIRGALGAVRAKSVDVRLVMISGSAEKMPSLPESWVKAWVRKPFEIAEILAALAPTT